MHSCILKMGKYRFSSDDEFQNLSIRSLLPYLYQHVKNWLSLRCVQARRHNFSIRDVKR